MAICRVVEHEGAVTGCDRFANAEGVTISVGSGCDKTKSVSANLAGSKINTGRQTSDAETISGKTNSDALKRAACSASINVMNLEPTSEDACAPVRPFPLGLTAVRFWHRSTTR